MAPNLLLLAADDPTAVLRHLQQNAARASVQDEHGYSLVHAAASYNHLNLLRRLVTEFKVPVDLRDEDAETALFVVETMDAARVLVEELGLDPWIKGTDGLTAREKFEAEGEYPEVINYLRAREMTMHLNGASSSADEAESRDTLFGLPEGLSVSVGVMDEAEDPGLEPDPEFKRRIEDLAARDDFHSAQGQEELRQLVMDAISSGGLAEDRRVRARQD